MSTQHDLQTRIRFSQILAQKLEARGLDVRNWLWFHPREEELDGPDPAIFAHLDLRQNEDLWRENFAPEQRQRVPDFGNEVLPWLRDHLLLVRIGGMGSHLVKPRPFEELEKICGADFPLPELRYGNTMSSREHCLERAVEHFRELLDQNRGSWRKILFLAHSRGAIIAAELMTEEDLAEFQPQIAGIVSFAGAIGGSPAATGSLAKQLKKFRHNREAFKKGLESIGRMLPTALMGDLLIEELPGLAEFPTSLHELSPERRQELLQRTNWPEGKLLLSLASVVAPGQLNLLEKFAGRTLSRRFAEMIGSDLMQHSVLNDTQVLLRDTKWPAASGGVHLGALHGDHWGMAYRQLMPLVPPDPTPREALLEAVLTLVYERLHRG